MSDPLAVLALLPGVPEQVAAARQACDELRWHPAMRRRSGECRIEAGVWAARSSAALEGARLPVSTVRDAIRGAVSLPGDGVGAVVLGATRAVAEADRLSHHGARAVSTSPWQALVRLHMAAVGHLVDAAAVGRPRVGAELPVDAGIATTAVRRVPDAADLGPRLDAVGELLSAASETPVAVLAAVVEGELLVLQPFGAGNGIVARALARALVVGRGLDPVGVAVPEAALLADPPGYALALAAYASGTADGVAAWLAFRCRALALGAAQGVLIADAVLAGRTPASP